MLDEFIGVLNQHLNGIPKELRDTAGDVKKHAIEESTCRESEPRPVPWRR